jgi:hypothetical protein
MQRIVLVCVLVLLVGGMVSCQGADTHQGKVVEASPGTLTMTNLEGKNPHTMDVPTTATVTRDGKTVTLVDLKPGDTITVTTAKTGTAAAVTNIEATSTGS